MERHWTPSMSTVHHGQRSVQCHRGWSTSRCRIACVYWPSCIPMCISRVTREVAGSGPMRRQFHGRIAASLGQLRAMHPTQEFEVVHVEFFGQRLEDGVDTTFHWFRHHRLLVRRKPATSHRGFPRAMEPFSFHVPPLQRARVSFRFDPVDVESRHRRRMRRTCHAWDPNVPTL